MVGPPAKTPPRSVLDPSRGKKHLGRPGVFHERPMNNPVFGSAGFTLLELLLVVAILSSLALAATTFVENEDDQQRFEETNRRLDLIQFAIVGENRPVYGGQALLSGYVGDNGVLPGSIADVLTKPTGYDDYGLKMPVFDPDPDASTCVDNGGATAWDEPAARLTKGHRGRYLTANSAGRFLDGWGYPWAVTTAASMLTLQSPGKNNLINAADIGYDLDLTRNIGNPAWQVASIAGWPVTIRNETGASVANLRASLLVYRFDAVSGSAKWRRYTTDRVASVAAGASATVSFLSLCGDPPVPQGRQLLVLVHDSDGTHHNNDDAPYDRDTGTTGIQAVTQQVNFFAGMSPPGGELVIR